MAQTPPRFCPRCGTPGVAGQRYCANCGQEIPPVPPSMQSFQPEFSAPQQYSQPSWAKPMPDAAYPQPQVKRSSRRAGIVLVLLLFLIIIGIGAYVGAGLPGLHLPGFNGGTGTNGGTDGTQPSVTTMPINATTTYAGVDVTILTAQQAQSFIDDPNTATTGMVRLHIQEQNKTSTLVSWNYSTIAHLILPGKRTVAPTFVQEKVGIAPGAIQQSFLDFAVPTSVKIGQLTLSLGAANEAQMDISLTGHADLSKYASKTSALNVQMSYLGLNWTLVSATSQLSIAGQQASKGMFFMIVTLKVDNKLSQEVIPGSAYDYIRLQSASVTASPKNTTLPVSFLMGDMGKTGTVTFLMPQGSTAFTFLLLSQGGMDSASADFQFS